MLESNARSVWVDLDITTLLLFYAIVLVGWFSIYAAIYVPSDPPGMFELGNRAGNQSLWISITLIITLLILLVDYRFWMNTPYIFYGVSFLLLVFVLIYAKATKGASSWIDIGPFKLQPSEFAKVTTALLFAKYFDDNRVKIGLNENTFTALLIIAVPAALVILQNDTGSFLVFASFIFVLYREGLSFLFPLTGLVLAFLFIGTFIIGITPLTIGLISVAALALLIIRRKRANVILVFALLAICLSVIYGTDYMVNEILQAHQKARILALFNPEDYASSTAYQTLNSMYAIGHGGFWGRGYLNGELTQLELVPEQFTDFIFCTIGEEHGWIGIMVVLGMFVTFLIRIVLIAERQNTVFGRVYGYSVASILFFHFLINIGMEIGLLPVIGIPLPMLSYGGSSLLSFTILVVILLKLDMHRSETFTRI